MTDETDAPECPSCGQPMPEGYEVCPTCEDYRRARRETAGRMELEQLHERKK